MTTTTNDITREALERARVLSEQVYAEDSLFAIRDLIAAALLRERADEAEWFSKFFPLAGRAAELRAAADELERGE